MLDVLTAENQELRSNGDLRMNLRQVEIMDAMVEIQEYILGKQEALLALLRERKSLLTAKEVLEKKNKEYEEILFLKHYNLLKNK